MAFYRLVPSGFKAGGPIQSCANMVAHLSPYVNFKIVTSNTDYCDETPYPGITSDTWISLSETVSIMYLSKSHTKARYIRRIIDESEYDSVHLNSVFSLYFSLIPMLYLKQKKKPVMLSTRGMLAEGALSVKSSKKKVFLKLSKILGLYDKLIFHATSDGEAQDIKRVFGSTANIQIAQNLGKKITNQPVNHSLKQSGKLSLISVARIAPEKNLKYALQILSSIPTFQIKFDVYGPTYNESYLTECKAMVKQLSQNVQVNFMGAVAHDKVASLFSNYDALFLPTLGENFGHIILEALTAGCPVIISDKTPWQNLQQTGAGYVIDLNQPQEFIKAINTLAAENENDFTLRRDAGRTMALNHINNPKLIQQYLDLFDAK